MRLKNLGERKILEKIIFPYLDTEENELDIDDDAVAYIISAKKYLVVNIDTFVRKTDAPPQMNYFQMGVKTVIMAISDIVAKGAIPRWFLLSVVVPSDLDENELKEIIRGVKKTCEEYNVSFSGGDLGEADDVILTGVALGIASRVVPRNGARPGDTVWSTGEFGLTGAALHYLLKGGQGGNIIDRLKEAFFYPRIDVRVGSIISRIASSSMDSSDGLAITLNTIARKSGVKITLDRIPIAKEALSYAKYNNINPLSLALYGGEEFEIIFTVSNLSDREVLRIFDDMGLKPPIRIGIVEKGSGVFYKEMEIPEKGWEHFTTQGESE